MQFNLRAGSGAADEMRIEHTRFFRRVDGAPATYAILSKADKPELIRARIGLEDFRWVASTITSIRSSAGTVFIHAGL